MEILGKEPLIKAYHQKVCNKCGTIIGFDNFDVITNIELINNKQKENNKNE